jgi:hypothetical protein
MQYFRTSVGSLVQTTANVYVACPLAYTLPTSTTIGDLVYFQAYDGVSVYYETMGNVSATGVVTFIGQNIISGWSKPAAGAQRTRPNVAVTLQLTTELPLTEANKTTTIVFTRSSNNVVVSSCPANAASCALFLQALTFPVWVSVQSTSYASTPVQLSAPGSLTVTVRSVETYNIQVGPKLVDSGCTSTAAGSFTFSLQLGATVITQTSATNCKALYTWTS